MYVDTSTTSTASWVQIKELKSYPDVGEGDLTRLDATHLESTVKEYIKDIPDMPDLTFTFNAMPESAANSNLLLLRSTLDTDKSYTWKLELPKLGITMTILADWTWSITNGGVSQIPEISLQLAGRSAMTISAYSAPSQSP